ncbi:MAG: heparinase II/III family protein [Kiritimatiellae bacterium]|nr:heparinase II/III family protein [Kiritimatiellia bacterium]
MSCKLKECLLCRITIASVLSVFAFGALAAAGEDVPWQAKIRKDHPRLFFNAETWPAIKARALSDGYARVRLGFLLKAADAYPAEPVCSGYGPVSTPPSTPVPNVNEFGAQAARCALAWRFTGNPDYLEKARKMLVASAAAYRAAYANRRAVHWYSERRILALCAYDWVFERLTPEQRREIIVPLVEHVEEVQPGPGKPAVTRRNTGGTKTGFYGVTSLLWYAGLAAHGDGFCDGLARSHLEKGYSINLEMLDFRAESAGDDGALVSGVPAYSMGAYPWAHFNFFHTCLSATGENIAMRYPGLALFPNWIWWTWIPNARDPLRPLQFGWGDDQHEGNLLDVKRLYQHMTQYMFFFREADPEAARLAATLRDLAPIRDLSENWPHYPFILVPENGAEPFTREELANFPLKARHFESTGQFFLRSGWEPDSTYCLFTAGARDLMHKHWDENNFVIYKHDFLALDSGSRGRETDTNLRYYYAQTVAHNCILIHKPGEEMPYHWGPLSDAPEARVSHGGQFAGSAKVRAFRTDRLFTYIAADAAPVYRGKCTEAARQFVHVQPDFFVIYDRVGAADAAYKKEWLLHTQNEPVVEGNVLRADCGKGRLFSETLLPGKAVLTKVGGPCREFWASGKNWELDPEFVKQAAERAAKRGTGPYFGNWRLEVSPAAPNPVDRFLHVLTAADTSREKPVAARLVRDGAREGVVLTVPGYKINGADGTLTATILFNRAGDLGGEALYSVRGADGSEISSGRFAFENIVTSQSGVLPSVPEEG